MWTRSAAAPACSKANWVSPSQLAPGARRINTLGVVMGEFFGKAVSSGLTGLANKPMIVSVLGVRPQRQCGPPDAGLVGPTAPSTAPRARPRSFFPFFRQNPLTPPTHPLKVWELLNHSAAR